MSVRATACLGGSALTVALLLGAMVTTDSAAQTIPSELTIELGDVVALPAGSTRIYDDRHAAVDMDLSPSARWFVITTNRLGPAVLYFLARDGTQTLCRVNVVAEGASPRRARSTDRLSVGGELRIPIDDIVSYREGDGTVVDVHVSPNHPDIVVVGLRTGRSALFLEHRTGRVEIRQIRVGS